MVNNINEFRSGFVSVVGRPNAGKSTLINKLMGEKISIVSPKPQTTRNSINCILSGDNYQIVLVDTPGIHAPKNKLGEFMVKSSVDTMSAVDAILYLIDINAGFTKEDEMILENLKKIKRIPILLLLNKCDKAKNLDGYDEKVKLIKSNVKKYINPKGTVIVSAASGENLSKLMRSITSLMPYGEPYYSDEYLTDKPERFVISEMIREKAMLALSDEIPYGIGVQIVTMTERTDKPLIDIEANIYCERSSHKGIVIGKNGIMLKKIGTNARVEIEALLGISVNLKLWVKVKNDWRDDSNAMKNLGYK